MIMSNEKFEDPFDFNITHNGTDELLSVTFVMMAQALVPEGLTREEVIQLGHKVKAQLVTRISNVLKEEADATS